MNTVREYKYKTVLRLLPIIALAFVACTENEADPFSGKDNYITAFSLTQGNTVFDAAIAGDVITVTVPEGLSLNNAKATVKLSENASIYPDPAKITAWDDEALFAVTAFNGARATYKYTVARSGIASEGSVVLETQADVDAFGQLGVTFIDGNLTIGRATGTDSITSLAPLAELKEVAYSLILHPTFAGTGLDGLENLERVGGTFQTGALKHLEILTLPALKIAGSVSLTNTVTLIVELPALERVVNAFSLNCPLYQLQLPNLKSTGDLTLTAASNASTSLAKISLPALEEAGNIVVSNLKSVAKIELPELKKSGGISFNQMTQLSFIYAPKLEETTGTVGIPSLNGFTEASFPELRKAVGISISGAFVKVLEFPKLIHVDNLILGNLSISNLADFPALQTAGTITLSNLSNMLKVTLPASIQRIDVLQVTTTYGTTNQPPEEINIKGRNIGELQVTANAVKVGKIIGDDVFHGTLTINPVSASDYPEFPVLEGFHEVDSLSVRFQGYMYTARIKGIRKINAGLTLPELSLTSPLEMPDLEEVVGNMSIERYGNGNLPVGQRFLEFPKLKFIGGNLDISTGYRGGINTEELRFPQLETISGKLYVHGYSSSSPANALVNLDGFAALRNVQSIEIKWNSALESYAGLQGAFQTSITSAAQWTAEDNGYNPSFEDLQTGKWIKE